jgi:predicted XRE-type DNA-binding protein
VAPIAVTESSGNVFADLGVAEPEAGLTKAQLASHIRHTIKRRRLTQLQAGELMGFDQPNVSALMNGRLAGFSSDRLRQFLAALARKRRSSSRRDHAGACAAKFASSRRGKLEPVEMNTGRSAGSLRCGDRQS